MKIRQYDTLKETLYYDVLPNGLQVFVVPKESYHKTYVTLSTPLGSTVTSIQTTAGTVSLPLGIAHFLEHKLFDKEGSDVSATFAMNSAQVNAYTMNGQTTYLFSCTDQLYANIDTLFDFVFEPVFTDEGVADEIGIIAQEITMYEDDPNTAIYMGMLQNLYHLHPVKEDILGTIDSIKTITKDLLYEVHSQCYHPSNMVLFITGQVDPTDVFPWLHQYSFQTVEPLQHTPKQIFNEPVSIVRASCERTMEVSIPNALLGIKLPIHEFDLQSIMKQELVCSILIDMLVGKSTPAFQTLLSKGLINDSFGMDITIEQDYGFLLFGSNTKLPEEFLSELKTLLLSASVATFSLDHFSRSKKQVIGHFIQALNSLEYIANQFTKYHFLGSSLFDVLDLASAIELDDIETFLKLIQLPSQMSTCIIRPK